MNNPLVSVIIPLYNCSQYIQDALASVSKQTYSNLEIIVIDDYSSDDSYAIVQQFNDPRIKLLQQPNSGAAAARNTGIKSSNGQFIQFLDADDLLSPEKIEKQVIQLQKSDKNSIASCGWIHFDDRPNSNQYIPQKIDASYLNTLDWLVDSWNGHGMGQTGVWLIPKELISKAGFWNVNLKNNPNDDGEFFCRIISQATSIIFEENVYVHYRRPRGSNVSQNKSKEAIESLLKSYKLYEYVLQFRDDDTIKMALANNYNNFIYVYHNAYPNLSKKAEQYVLELGQEVKIPFSNRFWNSLSRVFGWRGVMKIRKVMKGY